MSDGTFAVCDRPGERPEPALGTAPAAGPPAHANLILATTILASSLAFIDGSVVNVGLPAIGRSLGGGGTGLSWVVNGFLLPLSALLLIGGAAGDRYGRRLLLIVGVAVFAVASALCAAAPSFELLVAGRVLQGVGAAMLMPNSLAILGGAFTGEARGRAIGTWAAVGAAAGALGPLLGGWLIDAVDWRMIFLINLPIAAGAIVMALRYVPKSLPGPPTPALRAISPPRVGGAPSFPFSGGDPRTDGVSGQSRSVHAKLDLPGAVLAAAALGALTWGLTVASAAKGLSTVTGLALSGGALMMAAFLWVEHRARDEAMMPLALFASREFVGLTLLTVLLYGALGGLLVLVPFVLIQAAHYSATGAGAALLPLPLILSVASPTMGRLAGRIGSRLPLSIGPVVVAAGCLLAARIGAGGSYWTTVFPAMVMIALGMAAAVAPLTTAVLSSVDGEHTGVASGLNSAVARTGGLIATAFASVVLAAHGLALLVTFRAACVIGAVAALAAGVSAFLLVRAKPAPVPAKT